MIDIPVEVKKLLKQNNCHKNFRISFIDGTPDITNEQLVADSVVFQESICSRSKIEFGLCEASRLTFEAVGIGNIKGKTIDVSLEIDTSGIAGLDDVYSIGYGQFVVNSCEREANNNDFRKVECYSLIAQADWELNDITKALFENVQFARNSFSRHLTPEAVMDMLHPENLVTTKLSLSNNRNILYLLGTIGSDKYYLRVYYHYSMKNIADKVVYLKQTLSDSHISLVEETKNQIKELGFDIPVIHSNNVKNSIDNINVVSIDVPLVSALSQIKEQQFVLPFIYDASTNPVVTRISNAAFSTGQSLQYYLPYRFIILKGSRTTIYDSGSIEGSTVEINDSVDLFDETSNATINLGVVASGSYYKFANTDVIKDSMQNILESYLQFNAKFGRFGRDGSFQEISLQRPDGLVPANSLYPSDTLTPKSSTDLVITRGMTSKIWTSDEPTKLYGRVVAEWTDSNNATRISRYNIVDFSERVDPSDPDSPLKYNEADYQTYSISNNYFIKNNIYTEEEILAILETVGKGIEGVQYIPMELDCVGLPYVEAGDMAEVAVGDLRQKTYILERTLKGIQYLTDSFTSKG